MDKLALNNNPAFWLIAPICLCMLLMVGCGPKIVRSNHAPPEGVWVMTEGAYVIRYVGKSAAPVENPFLSLHLKSKRSPSIESALKSPDKISGGGVMIYGNLPVSTRLRVKEVIWKETSLFSGFWVKAEVISGDDAGMILTLPDLFRVVRSEEGAPRSFRFKNRYYVIEPAGPFVELVSGG